MKKLSLVVLIIVLTSSLIVANAAEKKQCKANYIDSGFLVFQKNVPKNFNGHIVTYRGYYNGGPTYQINFDNNKSTLTTNQTKKVESIVDSMPPLFVDFDVESYNDKEIKLRFTRFETPKCFNPNIKLKPM